MRKPAVTTWAQMKNTQRLFSWEQPGSTLSTLIHSLVHVCKEELSKPQQDPEPNTAHHNRSYQDCSCRLHETAPLMKRRKTRSTNMKAVQNIP